MTKNICSDWGLFSETDTSIITHTIIKKYAQDGEEKNSTSCFNIREIKNK